MDVKREHMEGEGKKMKQLRTEEVKGEVRGEREGEGGKKEGKKERSKRMKEIKSSFFPLFSPQFEFYSFFEITSVHFFTDWPL